MLRPNINTSNQRTLSFLNQNCSSVLELWHSNVLQSKIQEIADNLEQTEKAVSEAKLITKRVISESSTRAQDLLTFARELALLRYSLSDELSSLSEELLSSSNVNTTGPTLLEEIETLHRGLKELQNGRSYIQVMERAMKISERAISHARACRGIISISESFVADCQNLSDLASSLKQVCEQTVDDDAQPPKLVIFVDSLRDRTWASIKEIFSSSLLDVAERIRWPMKIAQETIIPQDNSDFEIAFRNLLVLQTIRDSSGGTADIVAENDGLYPLQALVKPISLRFRYHFEGARETNRPDKPEWYFTHILNMSYEHRDFMENFIQPILGKSEYKMLNAWREFTRLLLPILSRKIKYSIPNLLPYPSLLAHTVYESILFDNALRQSDFKFADTWISGKGGGILGAEWKGTSDIILGVDEWFNMWLEGEKKFAHDQYIEIISSENAWKILNDNEGQDIVRDDLRPTASARRCRALFEQITDRYRPLPRFVHKTKFLISVQVPILELYHTRISESLDAFETFSSFLVRAVPGSLAGQAVHGQTSKDMTSGVEGVQRLVKALLSAKYIASSMLQWGEEPFFLDLWSTISEKASSHQRSGIIPSISHFAGREEEGIIFDELIAQYSKLANRAESLIVRQVCGEVEAELKTHFYRDGASTSATDDQNDQTQFQTLVKPLACLSSHLSFLRSVLPESLLTTYYRRIASRLAQYVVQKGIMSFNDGRMTIQERQATLYECNIWIESCRSALAGAVRRVEVPWQTLLGISMILNADAEELQNLLKLDSYDDIDSNDPLLQSLVIADLSKDDIKKFVKLRDDLFSFKY